jgi:LacI family transcriptional regulator
MKRRIPKVALLLDGSRSYDRGLLRGIARYVALHEPWTLLRPAAFYQHAFGAARTAWEELWRQRPDGAIMNAPPHAGERPRLRIPAIMVPVGRMPARTHCLVSENRRAAELAADHLRGLGLRHFAFAGFEEAVWSLERREHFCQQFRERGLAVSTCLMPLSARTSKRLRGEAALVRWLLALPKPVGVMACNDEFARGLSELCRIHRLRVPDQVALIGVDNDESICDLCSPPLSSVSFATEQAGYDAAALLDTLMAGKRPPGDRVPRRGGKERKWQSILVHAGRVVARQSTDLLAVRDAEVAQALRFIRRNSHRLLQVNEVVEATLLTHRTLHNRFRRVVGHSLVQEINRRRATHIAEMLITTNDSIYRIARAIGYETAGHMSRFFRREMGVTPREYRLHRQERVPDAESAADAAVE